MFHKYLWEKARDYVSSADFLLQAARITAPPVDVRGLLEVLDIELKETDDPG